MITPFKINISNKIIEGINKKVSNYPWHEMPDDGGWEYGTNLDYMKEISKYWLDIIGLTHRADDDAGDLPYGDQRKLEIVRAMCINPHLLCLDEPAAGLNAKEYAELNKLLLFIKKEKKTGILLIEHDMSVVMEISDHVIVLNYGKKIFQGSPKETKNSPEVIEAYLGTEE